MTRSDEGSVFQRGGQWFARLRYTDKDGRTREKKRQVPTRSAGWAKIGELQNEIADELTDRKTYAELDAFYRAEYVHAARFVAGQKVSGFRQDVASVERYLDRALAFFGDKPLAAISYDDLRRYKQHVMDMPARDAQRSVSDVNHHMKRVRRVLKIAIEQGWLDVSPFDRGGSLIVESFETSRTRILSLAEEARLLAACDNEWRRHLKPVIIFAIETGMRRGEIKRLEWRHVDIAKRVIRVEALNTKTLKFRLVPITARLASVLAELRQNHGGSIRRHVFGPADWKTAFNKACDKAKLTDVHFHDLRHTAITRMLDHLSPALVMKISGHTQQRTFMRYVNQSEDSIFEIAMQLDGERVEQRRLG